MLRVGVICVVMGMLLKLIMFMLCGICSLEFWKLCMSLMVIRLFVVNMVVKLWWRVSFLLVK